MARGYLWSSTSEGHCVEAVIFKTGDFGLARLLFDATQDSTINHSSSIGVRGTVGYTPPEYGMGNEASSHRCTRMMTCYEGYCQDKVSL
ncbi:hypothetical protein CMV_009089 [Castanea mollissima]|uniref:Uncharacterized protein n=1 Tax=Castanea mollissima TaxID=60419 RepID=A0A8J4W1N0_9ROSI|nr:hypothetical protein CMV_009089 [Castanea mollissima]